MYILIFRWSICYFLMNICCICTLHVTIFFDFCRNFADVIWCDNTLCSIFVAFLFIRTDKADRDLYLPRFCRHIVRVLCARFLLRFWLQQLIKQIVLYTCRNFAAMSWRQHCARFLLRFCCQYLMWYIMLYSCCISVVTMWE